MVEREREKEGGTNEHVLKLKQVDLAIMTIARCESKETEVAVMVTAQASSQNDQPNSSGNSSAL